MTTYAPLIGRMIELIIGIGRRRNDPPDRRGTR